MCSRDWSSDVCSSDLLALDDPARLAAAGVVTGARHGVAEGNALAVLAVFLQRAVLQALLVAQLHAAEVQHAVLHGRLDALAAARPLTMEQRGHDAMGQVPAGAGIPDLPRSEDRRVGAEWVRTGGSR